MRHLLKQFVNEECSAYVRCLLERAIGDSARLRHHFEFNRFVVTVEHDENVVVLQDVLDATEVGVERVPLAEFTAALWP